ncbi:hypothetical protein [Geotalea uraniireducens]|nr:hypothetical protein [Geotalea uraniireducens]
MAGEIVLVDTGSRDRTVAITKENGCWVSFFHWDNDIALASLRHR